MNIHKEREACPVYTALAVIEGRWKPMIYQRLRENPCGFGALKRAMPEISTKVLRGQLRQMIADDLIEREELVPAWRGHRYKIASHGLTLESVFESLWRWGNVHLARPNADRGTRVTRPGT